MEIIVVEYLEHCGKAERSQDQGLRREGTRGVATAIKRGIIESQGELVGWMEADMSMPADLLPSLIEMTDQHPVVVRATWTAGLTTDLSSEWSPAV